MTRPMVFVLLFSCFAAALPAGGSRERGSGPDIEEVSGIVRLVGSGPGIELVISGPDKEWYIIREEAYKLMDLQYRVVTVEGEETVINLTFANGMPAGERRSLRNIKILSVQ